MHVEAYNLEKCLAEYFRRRHCILVGSGTTAIYVILKAWNLPESSTILYPDITCETAMNAAVYAGLTPVWGDIELNTYNLDLDTIPTRLQDHRIKVIVATHIFGHLMDIPALRKRADRSDLLILEDAAQAYGGEFQGGRAGSMGDASIISFGAGKLLDCGGGGAILTDHDELVEKCLLAARPLETKPPGDLQAKARYLQAVHQLNRQGLATEEYARQLNHLKRQFQDAYLGGLPPGQRQRIAEKFSHIDEAVQSRREYVDQLHQILARRTDWFLPEISGAPALWSYTFRIPRNRDGWYTAFMKRRIRCNRYFKPLHQYYGIADQDYRRAVDFYRSVINIDLQYDRETWREIINALEEMVGPSAVG